MAEWCLKSAVEQARALRAGKVTSSALVAAYIDRIEKLDGPVNCVVQHLFADARARAQEADAALARGEVWGPLHGVPVTIKESFMVKGSKTTCGIPGLKDYVSESHALPVQWLVDAGVVILGKTNIPIYTADHQSFNEIYGRTSNPFDLTRTPGGSSGGSAASMACGFGALELGSDIGGSIRIPAHFCGVCGHKPSQGLGHLFGHVSSLAGPANHRHQQPRDKLVAPIRARMDPSFGHPLAVSGPIARCCADLELAMRLLARPEPVMAKGGWSFSLPPAKCTEPRALRCAAWLEQPKVPTDTDYLGLLRAAVAALEAAGASVDHAARPFTDEEVRKHVATFGSIIDMWMGSVSKKWTFSEYTTMSVKRNFIKEQWDDFFKEYDVLLCPVLPIPAYPHSDVPTGKRRYNGTGIPEFGEAAMSLWPGIVIVADLPSTVVPIGRTSGGLPCGMQIVAPNYHDLTCIEVGKMLERVHAPCRYSPPPGFGPETTSKL